MYPENVEGLHVLVTCRIRSPSISIIYSCTARKVADVKNTALDILLDLGEFEPSNIPSATRQLAVYSLYDWVLCGLAGQSEPVSGLIRQFADNEGGKPIATLVGGGKATARVAALVNGTISHALDFDDTHFAHIGHLSVGIYPAVLAAAEEIDASFSEVLDSFVIGAEAAIRVGITLGPQHYNRGFHQTATAGAFGACVAAARLYGLDRLQTTNAIGLCATRSSGLKSQFGTMGKPYNAGIAASNGIETAKLAQLGFSAPRDGLSGAQGFVLTHADAPQRPPEMTGQFLFDEIRYKFHACCHGTHAMIEALLDLMREHKLALDDVVKCQIRTNPRWMDVCNIQEPRSGLEVKFSYAWLAGMTLDNRPTGSISLYEDTLTEDRRLSEFAKRVEVVPDDALGEMQSKCRLRLSTGRIVDSQFDLEERIAPNALEAKLRKKASEILGEHASSLAPLLDSHAGRRARDITAIFDELALASAVDPA